MIKRMTGQAGLVIALLTIALALRIAAALLIPPIDIAGYSESGVTARNLAEGRGYTFDLFGARPEKPLQSFMPPLYTLLIAACLKYLPGPMLGLRLIQAVLSSVSVIAVYYTATRLSSNRGVGLLAGLGVAVYPVFVIMSAYPLSVTLEILVLSLLLLASVALRDRMAPGPAALVGFLSGVAFLARPTLLGFLPFILAWLCIGSPDNRRALPRLAVIILACALVPMLPWIARNSILHGQVVLGSTNGGFAFWNGNNPFTTGSGHEVYTDLASQFMGVPPDPQAPRVIQMQPYPLPPAIQAQIATIDEVELDRLLFRAGLDYIRDNPGRWFQLAQAKLQGFWWFRQGIGRVYEAAWTRYYQIGYLALLLAVIPGLVLSLRDWRTYSLLYMLFGYYTVVFVAFHVQTRYRWEIEPYLVVLGALAVWEMGRLILEFFRQRGLALNVSRHG